MVLFLGWAGVLGCTLVRLRRMGCTRPRLIRLGRPGCRLVIRRVAARVAMRLVRRTGSPIVVLRTVVAWRMSRVVGRRERPESLARAGSVRGRFVPGRGRRYPRLFRRHRRSMIFAAGSAGWNRGTVAEIARLGGGSDRGASVILGRQSSGDSGWRAAGAESAPPEGPCAAREPRSLPAAWDALQHRPLRR